MVSTDRVRERKTWLAENRRGTRSTLAEFLAIRNGGACVSNGAVYIGGMALSNQERQARWRGRAQEALRLVTDETVALRNMRAQQPTVRHLVAWWCRSRLDGAFRNLPEADRAAFLEWLSLRRNPPRSP